MFFFLYIFISCACLIYFDVPVLHLPLLQMKEGRRLGGVHAGPESKVLDGLSWEEVKNMQDAQPSQVCARMIFFTDCCSICEY